MPAVASSLSVVAVSSIKLDNPLANTPSYGEFGQSDDSSIFLTSF